MAGNDPADASGYSARSWHAPITRQKLITPGAPVTCRQRTTTTQTGAKVWLNAGLRPGRGRTFRLRNQNGY